jgi:serine protease Do
MSMKKKVLMGSVGVGLFIAGCTLGHLSQASQAAAAPPAQAAPVEPSTASLSGRALPSFATLAEQVEPCVVFIKAVSVEKTGASGHGFGSPDPFGEESPLPGFRFPQPPSGEFKRRGTGSGFIVRSDGLILTNNHVVDNAKQITVVLNDEREFEATVVGRDPKTDLAVLKINAKGALPVAKLGDSEHLRVGDWVMAIGNPFGLSNTVTAGIVSAKGRVIGAGPYDDFIQTDASINPGNSGGPLFNENGEAVGINSAIFSQSGGNIGIGFAIPINMAKQLMPELEAHGSVTRGWLGVAIQKVTPDLAKSLDLDEAHGALVGDVTGHGPAAKAGLARGDVILKFDDKPVKDAAALPTLVAGTPVGKTVPVEVVRDGKHKTFEVTIAKLEDTAATHEPETPSGGKWGMGLRDLKPEERQRAGLDAAEGVLVTEVAPGSPAEEAGIEAGNVILQVNQTPVGSVDAVKREANKVTGGKPLLLLVRVGDGQSHFAALAAK